MTRVFSSNDAERLLDVPYGYQTSGEFICGPILANTIAINNAYFPHDSPLTVKEYAYGRDAVKLYDACGSTPHILRVNREHFTEYASQIVKGVRIVNEMSYDVVLFPLRGVRNVAVQATVMSPDNSNYWAIDGTQMWNSHNDQRIQGDLRSILAHEKYQGRHLRIGIVDTAKGGNGCHALANHFDQIHTDNNAQWDLHFHLFHSQYRDPALARTVITNQGNVRKAVDFYPVQDLLFEDESRLLGYELIKEGKKTFAQRFQEEGQILLPVENGYALYEPAPLDTTMIAIMGNAITEELQTLPDVELSKPLVD